ncbi:MAG: DUF2277 domain-containing protein [Planctomycetes bacterium]|nr:DUF2277 domain-containing protein [Planctomycetota bacterium]
MCRSIKTLHNFEPPATAEEIEAAAIQFVRKLSGTRSPSRANQATFDKAVVEITASATQLLEHLVTQAPAKNRDAEAQKARRRWEARGK